MSVTSIQYSGILNNEIQKEKDLEEKLSGEEKIKKIFDDGKREISSIGETDLRQVREYNLNGHHREDYDTEKKLDIFA